MPATRLPIFPLPGAILFPGLQLPLHVFEPRYRSLVGSALAKDRPLLVVGRRGGELSGLMLSSQHDRDGDRDWVSIGSGDWDRQGRESFIRLDRVLEIGEHDIRREGAVLERDRFERVAARLRSRFGWS